MSATISNEYTNGMGPFTPSPGVTLMVSVPLPLSVNVIPTGRRAMSGMLNAVGGPGGAVVVMVIVLGDREKRRRAGLVNRGGTVTVSVKFFVTGPPTPLLAMNEIAYVPDSTACRSGYPCHRHCR